MKSMPTPQRACVPPQSWVRGGGGAQSARTKTTGCVQAEDYNIMENEKAMKQAEKDKDRPGSSIKGREVMSMSMVSLCLIKREGAAGGRCGERVCVCVGR